MSSSSTISTNAHSRRARVTRAMPGDRDWREYNEVPIGDRTSTPQCWRTGEGAGEGQQGQGRGAVLPPLPEVLHRDPRVLPPRLLFHSTCPGGGPRDSCASSPGSWMGCRPGLLHDKGEGERAQGGPRRFARRVERAGQHSGGCIRNQGPQRRGLDKARLEGEEEVPQDALHCGHKDGACGLDGRDVREGGDGRRLRRLVRDAEGQGQEGPRRRSLRLEGELRLRRGGGDKAGHRGQERLRAEERGSQARKQAVIE